MQELLEDLKKILEGVVATNDLERSIDRALNNEECDDPIPFIEIEENCVYCEFETNGKEIGSKEIIVQISIINGTKYYFLGGGTYEWSNRTPSGKIWSDDGTIIDYGLYIEDVKEALEKYIKYGDIGE